MSVLGLGGLDSAGGFKSFIVDVLVAWFVGSCWIWWFSVEFG